MPHNYLDELKIKDIQEVRFAFSDLNLLHEGLKKNLYGNALIFPEYISEITQHKFSNVEFFMILDKKEG